jgi:uncharacterized protein
MNRLSFFCLAMILIVLFAFRTANGLGQEPQGTSDSSGPPVIRTLGEAVLTVEPDLAEIQVGVETEDPSAQTAAEKNAARSDAVLKALRELLGRDADIKTIGYWITPVYSTPRNGKTTLSHYKAVNTLFVRTDRIKRMGEIIDRANKAGANTTGGLQFTIKDDAAVQLKALERASRDARAKAEAIASALGIKIKRVLEVREIGQGLRPYARNRGLGAFPQSAAAATPVEAGTLDIRASVTMTVEVSP